MGFTDSFNDLAVKGADAINNIAPNSTNPAVNYLKDQGQQLVQSATNAASSEIRDLTAGITANINAALPFPSKRLMTFFLLDQNGALAIPTTGTFQPGYLFNLSINPSSFKNTLPAKTVNEVRTLGGWNLQHWYPELGSISADGIIGNLLQKYNTDIKKTTQWDNFKKLINVYMNNSIPYKTGAVNRNTMNALFNPTAVIVYHNVTYYGYFANFDIDENQEQPWTRGYTFTFKYTDMIDTMDIVARTTLGITSSVNQTLTGSLGGLSTAINNNLNPLSNI